MQRTPGCGSTAFHFPVTIYPTIPTELGVGLRDMLSLPVVEQVIPHLVSMVISPSVSTAAMTVAAQTTMHLGSPMTCPVYVYRCRWSSASRGSRTSMLVLGCLLWVDIGRGWKKTLTIMIKWFAQSWPALNPCPTLQPADTAQYQHHTISAHHSAWPFDRRYVNTADFPGHTVVPGHTRYSCTHKCFTFLHGTMHLS